MLGERNPKIDIVINLVRESGFSNIDLDELSSEIDILIIGIKERRFTRCPKCDYDSVYFVEFADEYECNSCSESWEE